MFSNCPYCGFLVALDEAGQPLSRCPNCAQRLRDDDASTDVVASTTPADDGAGTTASNTASHASEPAPSAPTSTLESAPEPQRSEAGAVLARETRTTPATPTELPSVAAGNETASRRPNATSPSVVPDSAPLARQDAAPKPITTQANADGDADAMQPAVAAEPASIARTPEGEAPTAADDTGSADAKPTPLRTASQVAPPPDTDAVTTEAAPAAANAQRAKPGEAGETDGVAPSLPTTAPDAEPVSGSGPEPDAQPAAAMTDDSAVGSADDSATATEASVTTVEKTPARSPAAVPLAAESSEGVAPGLSDGAMSAATAQGKDVATPATMPATSAPQAADATVETAPATPPKPARRKPGATAVPSFARARVGAVAVDRRRLALRWAAIAALSLLLVLQLLLSDRARLAGDARWRGLLTQLCGVLQCTLPAWREPRAFRVIERDITLRRPGVLRVNARIRNDARWAQPWPALQLTLSDANGRDVATRVFTPSEYLGGMPTQSELGSGQSAALSMEVVEPGPQAVAFTFDFH
jgi:hypothetical protein